MSNDEIRTLIKCADCLHCKQFREINDATGRYVLKVRCAMGHWKRGRKHGDCDLHKILGRRSKVCADYVSMSEDEEDRRQYIKTLATTLPLDQVQYHSDGEPVDATETQACRYGR